MKDIILFSILIVAIDSIYLSHISVPFGKMIRDIQGKPMKMKMMPAVIVYLAMIATWYVFIYKELKRHSFTENIVRAALLGLFTYSIFDFTNMALIDGYRLDLAVIDSLWGATLYGITTAIFIKGLKYL